MCVCNSSLTWFIMYSFKHLTKYIYYLSRFCTWDDGGKVVLRNPGWGSGEKERKKKIIKNTGDMEEIVSMSVQMRELFCLPEEAL